MTYLATVENLVYLLSEQAVKHFNRGRGVFMVLPLRRAIVFVVLALVLLIGLFGWTIKMAASTPVQHHTSIHSSHALAWYCPAPPRVC
jgi:hypothetical protein